jgi:hypothetical protein
MVRGAWRASAPVAPRRRARGVLAARSNRAGAFAGALSAAARAQGARGAGGPPARVGPGGRAAGGRPAAAPACRRLLRRRLSDPPGHARLRRLAAGRGRRAPARARARRAPALSQLAVRRRAGLARGAPSRAPVRAGGRWDGLLQAAWAPFALSAGAPPCAAGVTLNVDRLLDCLPAARAPALRASQARCALRWREGRGCRLRGGVMRRRPVRRVAHDRGASGATQAGPAAALSGTAPLRGRDARERLARRARRRLPVHNHVRPELRRRRARRFSARAVRMLKGAPALALVYRTGQQVAQSAALVMGYLAWTSIESSDTSRGGSSPSVLCRLLVFCSALWCDEQHSPDCTACMPTTPGE